MHVYVLEGGKAWEGCTYHALVTGYLGAGGIWKEAGETAHIFFICFYSLAH